MKIIKEPFMQLQPEHFISVTFETEVKDADSVRELIEKCAKNVLERENIPFDAEIDARVVDAEEIRRLNAEFRDKDVVTDVLSFPMFDYYNGAPREDLEPDPESGRVMLGDMVLCYTRACEQAEEYGHSAARECGFLTTHSVLHLLGYDHERGEDDTARMRPPREGIPRGDRPDARRWLKAVSVNSARASSTPGGGSGCASRASATSACT